MPTIPAEVVFF